MGVFGGNNTYYVQTASAIMDQGTGNTITECGSDMVVFTYGSAPSSDCSIVGIDEVEGIEMSVYPNPAKDQITLDPGLAKLEKVEARY
jgi:hypothetical protein